MSPERLIFLCVSAVLGCLILIECYRAGYHEAKQNSVKYHPIHSGFEYRTRLPNGLMFSGNVDNFMEVQLLLNGYYEPQTVEVLQRSAEYLKKSTLKMVYVDIGANVGMSLLPVADIADEIIAVEPYPPVIQKLRRNIELNSLGNVKVLEVGFGNEKATVKFATPPIGHHGIGTFSKDVFDNNAILDSVHAEAMQVSNASFQVVPGDDLLMDSKVKLMKIDIEGYERYALEGLKKTIESYQPLVVLELNKNEDGGFLKEQQLIDAFPATYSFFQIASEKSAPCISPLAFDPDSFEQKQVVAVSEQYKLVVPLLEKAPCGNLP